MRAACFLQKASRSLSEIRRKGAIIASSYSAGRPRRNGETLLVLIYMVFCFKPVERAGDFEFRG